MRVDQAEVSIDGDASGHHILQAQVSQSVTSYQLVRRRGGCLSLFELVVVITSSSHSDQIDPIEWKTELERVGPKLKAQQVLATNEWR